MNRRQPTRSLCALAVTALMAHGAALAAKPSQEELQRIKVYGNVTLAQDSASEWGPWEQFEPPMAGTAPVEFLHSASTELYRPLAQVDAPTDRVSPCAAGSICGYGVFVEQTRYLKLESMGSDTLAPDEHPYQLTVNVLDDVLSDTAPTEPVLMMAKAAASEDPLPGAIEVLSTPLSTGSFLTPRSPTLTRDEEGYSNSDWAGGQNYSVELGYWANQYFDVSVAQATWFYGDNSVRQGEESTLPSQGQYFRGVAGIVTSAADMLALPRAGEGAKVTYSGYDSFGLDNYTKGPNVVVNVDFATQKFQATFNGGVDKGLGGWLDRAEAKSGTILGGAVGFVAEGNISGSNFKSTSVSAQDATAISGSVVGSFFGSNAAAVGGVADITKSKAAVQAVMEPTSVVMTSSPVAVVAPAVSVEVAQPVVSISSPGYTNARFVSPFLAVRGKPYSRD
jgi:C-lobe and N-lobe beta barrels of Tf-binding protein B